MKPAPPSWRFLFSHPTHLIACGLGSGLSPVAPGTAGTLFAWAVYPLLRSALGIDDGSFAVFLLLAFVFGVEACQRTGRDLGMVDHGAIVWDEIVPFWLVLLLTPAGLPWQLAAFLLFRCFDIVKPSPADWFDEKVKNGLGVMMDDLVAAGYTLLALAVAKVLLA
ncbi:MAG: phosphatidylglycerophosphatase A [Sterolibacterium sp.]|nr:phosphatidylglycerophosphatase A [Sterolibacterium sp.]